MTSSGSDNTAKFDVAQAIAAKNALNAEFAAAGTGWIVSVKDRGARRFVARRSLVLHPDVAAGATELEAVTLDQLREQIRTATANDTPYER